MKLKAVAAVALKRALPAMVGLIVLTLAIAWLAGAFTKRIPPGRAAMAGEEADSGPSYGTYKVHEIEKSYIEEAIGTVRAASRTEISSRVLATIDRIAEEGDVAQPGVPLLSLYDPVSLLLGAAALYLTPREEEPQIVVPLADVRVSAPGLSAHEVEEKVTNRLEKLLYQIDGVEYVYSMSRPGECIVTVRFYVGEDREDSILKLYNKLHSNLDRIPPAVAAWVVKPVEVDDVPIVNVTLWSDRPELYGDHELRRMAEQLVHELKRIPDTNSVEVIGGRPRRIRVELKPSQLAARGTSALDVAEALKASNVNVRAGQFEQQNEQFAVEAGTFVRNARELEELVIQVSGGRPVYLKDVADVLDGPAEVESYTWIGFGPAAEIPFDSKDRAATGAGSGRGIGEGAGWLAAERSEAPGGDGLGHRFALPQARGANIKLVEVPPGPPVIATVTAEVYGPPDRDYKSLVAAARRVEKRLQREPGIVDVDSSAEDDRTRLVFETDQPKAALSGVSKENVANTMKLALDGLTATAMIGMIALAGIVVRNSVVLIDFIHHGQAEGLPLREAVIQSAAVRTRPIFLTAGTTLLGNWVITLDPIFSGLAWAIIFGVFTSTVFTLLVVPVVYWMLYGGNHLVHVP